MDVLKKVKSASLVESLTASIIILIVFTIALTSFNSIFHNNINRNNSALLNRISELGYIAKHGKLEIPFSEEKDYWEIYIKRDRNQLVVEAYNKKSSLRQTSIIDLN